MNDAEEQGNCGLAHLENGPWPILACAYKYTKNELDHQSIPVDCDWIPLLACCAVQLCLYIFVCICIIAKNWGPVLDVE